MDLQLNPESGLHVMGVAIAHHIKAKDSSGLYHVPGGTLYERTIPDRCYASTEAAESDGYRPSQR